MGKCSTKEILSQTESGNLFYVRGRDCPTKTKYFRCGRKSASFRRFSDKDDFNSLLAWSITHFNSLALNSSTVQYFGTSFFSISILQHINSSALQIFTRRDIHQLDVLVTLPGIYRKCCIISILLSIVFSLRWSKSGSNIKWMLQLVWYFLRGFDSSYCSRGKFHVSWFY